MEFIDAKSNREYVSRTIEKNGYCNEHNLAGFFSYQSKDEISYFVCFDRENGYGILAYRREVPKKNLIEWTIYSEILGPKNLRIIFLEEFLNYCFANGARKVWIETPSEFRAEVLAMLKTKTTYRANSARYTLFIPVYNLETWDGDKMAGAKWKKLRHTWNKFFREHKVEFLESSQIDKKLLKDLVKKWNKERTSGDRADCNHYNRIIDSDFEGYTHTRIMVVDGKVSAITAGFKIPNTNGYYSAVGIYSREFEGLGEVANMDDLIFLKKKGYDFADFGGGEEKLTDFKKKFKPESIYKTHSFSIVPVKNS